LLLSLSGCAGGVQGAILSCRFFFFDSDASLPIGEVIRSVTQRSENLQPSIEQ
jgi:hypothetical protein